MVRESSGYRYRLEVEADFDTRVRLALELPDAEEMFHLIPCNIHGDNNLALTGPGEYPHLTDQHPDDIFCAPLWELRADRAALPVSILCHCAGAVGISIDPYSEQEPDQAALNDQGFIRNGVFAALPSGMTPSGKVLDPGVYSPCLAPSPTFGDLGTKSDKVRDKVAFSCLRSPQKPFRAGSSIGVSLGYGNEPGSFVEKQWLGETTRHLFRKASATGRILAFSGDRRATHRIIRALYADFRDVPQYHKTLPEAISGVMDAWLHVNWGPVGTLGGREYYRNGGLRFDQEGIADGRPLCWKDWPRAHFNP